MTTEKNIKKQSFKPSVLRRRVTPSGLPKFIFLLIGMTLTIAAFIALNVFVQGLIRSEYERLTRNTVETMVGGLQGLEQSVETMRAMLSLSGTIDKRVILDKIKQSGVDVERFDQIVWLSQQGPGKWQFQVIYQKDLNEGLGLYEVKPTKAFISYVLSQKPSLKSKRQVLTIPEYFNEKSAGTLSLVHSQPFALMQAIKPNDFEAGVIVGVAHSGAVFDPIWIKNNESVSRLIIRELGTDQQMYSLDRGGSENDRLEDYRQLFEFEFAGRSWEVGIVYAKEDKTHFLEMLPLSLIIFGVVMTLTGTLYIHSNQQQSITTLEMNKVLEKKNTELEHEVGERTRLNQVLTKSERDHRAILDSVSDIIFETDAQGKILFLNQTWQKITGFDLEQSKGMELFKMLNPQDQEKQLKDFHALVKGQKQAYRSFTRVRIADGSFRAVELALSMLRHDENKDLRVVGTITDVEERRRAERALAEAEKKYRTIVENAAGGIYQVTPEGVYLSANPALARILGYDSPEDLVRSIKNAHQEIYCNPRERQSFLRELEGAGMISNFETEVFRKGGQKVWVNENARVVKDDMGNVLYFEGSLEDITRRKAADVALREAKIKSDMANRAKSEFLANMSHELRTPLNSIIGFSEIIKNESFGAIGQESYKEYAKEIHQSGSGLLKIISEILDISKIEAGERQLNESAVDIGKVVASCVSILEGKAEAGRLTVTNALEKVPQIVGEELAIKQIITNLLSNAIKFTPQGGRVTISSEITVDGDLRLSFTDTGVGLDKAEIAKALSPFGQVNSELNRSNAGTGLGLTLVDALTKLHGGRFELFSEKGIGTTATVVFPAARVMAKKDKKAPEAVEKA